MAPRPEGFPHDALVNELAVAFRRSQYQILAQINAAISSGKLRLAAERRMQLAAVVATLDQLGAYVDPLARQAVRRAFIEGSEKTARDIAGIVSIRTVTPATFTGVSEEAIKALQDAATDRLDLARRGVGRRVEDFYAKAGRRAVAQALLGADGSPDSARKSLTRIIKQDPEYKRLQKQGITGFVDRANKKWRLDTYSEMVVRTTTREAVVQGQMLRMAANGVELARVSSHMTACDLCRPYEGKLISLSGGLSEYQGEAILPIPFPPFHPNCRHTLEPVVLEVEQLRQQLEGQGATG